MESRWDRIETLFAEALLREVTDRMSWLRAQCPDDPDLRSEVEAMLAAHTRPLGIEPLLLAEPQTRPHPLLGSRVGPYRLLELLGRGGMGSVWLAEHADGTLDRRVAVKLVRLAYSPDEAGALRRRFEAERRILARLEHPGIVRLLEAGTAGPGLGVPEGTPYFAMDYVAGVPLTTYAETHRLRVPERLRLFAQVCDAVHHAHQRLVVHRDLKPSNILVAGSDAGDAHVKLLDFGIARLLDDDHAAALTTETGLRPMTRAYAAPEQIRGEPATTATDVYALGVVLYELLTGRRPFEEATPAQLEHAIVANELIRPSLALAETDRTSGIAPHHVRGDLDAIVLTALRKAPDARYGSAEALAADVRRHLDGLPVRARPPSLGYRARVFARRYRVALGAAGAALALLITFTVALAIQQREVARERDTAQATADFLEGLFGAANPLAGERLDTLRTTDLLRRGAERVRVELTDQPLVRARLLHAIGRSYVRLAAYAQARGLLREAVDLSRAEGDPATLASSLAELAAVHQIQWQLVEAEALAREALDLARSLGDPALTARTEHVLALTLLNAGQPEEVEVLLQNSIGRQRASGSDDTTILMAEQALARALIDQHRLEEAERLLADLEARHADRFGPRDGRLIGVLNLQLFLYLATGRLTEAEAAGAAAVRLVRDVQPGSGALSQTLATYAAVLRRQGQLDRAQALLGEALTLPEVRPGAHAVPLGTLASVLYEQNDLDGAIAAQRRAVHRLRADTTGATRPATVDYSRIKLAGFLRAAGRFSEAERELLAVQAERDATGAGAQSHSPQPVAALVDLYEAWGRPEAAARWSARLDE